MSHYEAHLLYNPASPPKHLPRLARPKTYLGFSTTAKHGFVFCSEGLLGIDRQYQLRFLTEVFSDNVVPLHEGLFYGSLAYTWNYFLSRDHLRRHVEKQKLGNTAVIVGEHLFRSFVYLLMCSRREGFQFACSDDLVYRRFLQKLTWDDWALGATQFYDLILLDEKEGFKEELTQFVQSLKQLRFKGPGQVALDCTHLPTALMERFGGRCAWLWNAWITNDDTIEWPQFKEYKTALNPAHFATAVFETPEFTERYVLHAQEFLEAIRACLMMCLKKISTFNDGNRSYGLQNFKVSFTVQSIRHVERIVNLAVPLYEWSKTAASIVETASAHLLDAIEEDVEGDLKRVYNLTHISELSVMPLQLSMKQQHLNGLFGEVYDSQILEVRDTLRAFDRSAIEVYRTQPELPVKQSFANIETSWKLPQTSEWPTAAAWMRPICVLKSPKKVFVRHLKRLARKILFFKTECIEDWDYYVVTLQQPFTMETQNSLWMAFPIGTKVHLDSVGFLVGFFDSDFNLPTDLQHVQRCAYV